MLHSITGKALFGLNILHSFIKKSMTEYIYCSVFWWCGETWRLTPTMYDWYEVKLLNYFKYSSESLTKLFSH